MREISSILFSIFMNQKFLNACLVSLSLLFGCVAVGVAGQTAGQTDNPIVASAPSASSNLEEELKTRAESRWSALIERDWETAFQFYSPAYRSVYGIDTFLAQFGDQVSWIGATVDAVNIKTAPGADASTTKAPVAEVMVTIFFTVPFGSPEKPIISSNLITERWLRKDDQWWYVSG